MPGGGGGDANVSDRLFRSRKDSMTSHVVRLIMRVPHSSIVSADAFPVLCSPASMDKSKLYVRMVGWYSRPNKTIEVREREGTEKREG